MRSPPTTIGVWSWPLWFAPDGVRLLSYDTVRDVRSSDVLGRVPLPANDERVAALWIGDRIVTLDSGSRSVRPGGSRQVLRYAETSFDGALLSEAVVAGPGIALLPLGPQVVLVRMLDERPDFTVLAPGSGDLDRDGAPDGADVAPLDPRESFDRDGDGVGDELDAFPDDPNERADTDGDGLGDQGDFLAGVPGVAFGSVAGKETLSLAGIGRLKGEFSGQLHLLAGGGFALCTGHDACIGGALRPDAKGRVPVLELVLAPESLRGLRDAFEPDLERALRGRAVKLPFVETRSNGSLLETGAGTVRIRLRARHRARVERIGSAPGSYRVDASGTLAPLPPRQ